MGEVRPDWNPYFLKVAEAVSLRADCRRRQVGCVVVGPDNWILSTGYNGVRAGAPGCLSGACPRGRLTYEQVAGYTDYSDPSSPGYCISSHAEVNAKPVRGSRVYITDEPCPACHKYLFNIGVVASYWPGGSRNYEHDILHK